MTARSWRYLWASSCVSDKLVDSYGLLEGYRLYFTIFFAHISGLDDVTYNLLIFFLFICMRDYWNRFIYYTSLVCQTMSWTSFFMQTFPTSIPFLPYNWCFYKVTSRGNSRNYCIGNVLPWSCIFPDIDPLRVATISYALIIISFLPKLFNTFVALVISSNMYITCMYDGKVILYDVIIINFILRIWTDRVHVTWLRAHGTRSLCGNVEFQLAFNWNISPVLFMNKL